METPLRWTLVCAASPSASKAGLSTSGRCQYTQVSKDFSAQARQRYPLPCPLSSCLLSGLEQRPPPGEAGERVAGSQPEIGKGRAIVYPPDNLAQLLSVVRGLNLLL
jgi:hypothetical protein